MQDEKQPLLISACLLGLACRYDGCSKPLSPEILGALTARYCLVPVCPEQMGGLPTPRTPAERVGAKVLTRDGIDVTQAYHQGAKQALLLAWLLGCTQALLKEFSPSCGFGTVYDGSFSRHKIPGNGVLGDLLAEQGIRIWGERAANELLYP